MGRGEIGDDFFVGMTFVVMSESNVVSLRSLCEERYQVSIVNNKLKIKRYILFIYIDMYISVELNAQRKKIKTSKNVKPASLPQDEKKSDISMCSNSPMFSPGTYAITDRMQKTAGIKASKRIQISSE